MEYDSVTKDQFKNLIESTGAPIVPEFDNDNLVALRISIGDSHIKIGKSEYGSSMQVFRPTSVTRWRVTAELDGGMKSDKSFESEGDANDFAEKLKERYDCVDSPLVVDIVKESHRDAVRFIADTPLAAIE